MVAKRLLKVKHVMYKAHCLQGTEPDYRIRFTNTRSHIPLVVGFVSLLFLCFNEIKIKASCYLYTLTVVCVL